jgi:hypothetical protein
MNLENRNLWIEWVLASAVGWGLGGFLSGSVHGAITGYVLVRLLRMPLPLVSMNK